jgi:hypothetical protein
MITRADFRHKKWKGDLFSFNFRTDKEPDLKRPIEGLSPPWICYRFTHFDTNLKKDKKTQNKPKDKQRKTDQTAH